jgi:hypothetical protein
VGAGLVELLTVDPAPAVGDPSFDETQDAVGLVDRPFAGGGGRTGTALLGTPPRAIEGEFWRQLFVVEGAAWCEGYCWRGAQSELVSVGAEKGRDFSLLNSQSNISNGKY